MDSWGKEENEQDLKKTTQLKGALENSHRHQEDRQRKRSYSQTNLTEVKCKKRFLLASLEGEECKWKTLIQDLSLGFGSFRSCSTLAARYLPLL